MKLDIVNDTELNISCDIIVNDQHYVYESSKQRASYELNPKEGIVNIQLSKRDIWKPRNVLNSVFLSLYILDLVFGNLSESENLPFLIDYRLTLTTADLTGDQKLSLSDIVKVDHESLNQWTKYSIFQCSMVAAMIAVIGLVLSFIFNGLTKAIFLIGIAILFILVFKLTNKKRRKLLKALKTFI